MTQDTDIINILILALLPVIILLFYIYRRDKKSPEPIGLLIKTFFFCILSAPLSFFISVSLEELGFYTESTTSIIDCVNQAFFEAAIPEELTKLFMLWLILRNNKYFDEKTDGIVYAVFISMGFAALENILYLFEDTEEYLSVGIVRGLFSIPGHFCFGVLMGYYYSLVKFYKKNRIRNMVFILLAPVIVHGLYDYILMSLEVTSEIFNFILIIVFLVLCSKMWKYASERIKEHLWRDDE